MLAELRKLRGLLEKRDVLQFGLVFGAILITALLEVVGIAAVLPFMRLVAEPETLHTNAWLSQLYARGDFASERALLIWMGVAVIVLFSLSRLVAAFTVWLTNRSVWSMAHRLSGAREAVLEDPQEWARCCPQGGRAPREGDRSRAKAGTALLRGPRSTDCAEAALAAASYVYALNRA